MEAKSQDQLSAQSSPSQREADLLQTADLRLLRTYLSARVIMVRGRGCELFDTEGRRYLDFCAGIATCSLGHAHPELSRVIAEQASTLMHVSNYFFNIENVKLAEELCAATGFDRAFFCNSGAEANEGMLKLARRYFYERGDTDRVRIIAFDMAFHGRTMGALSMGGNPRYRVGFGELLAGVDHVPYGDLEVVRAKMGPDVAAVIAEPVQGEGGVLAAPSGFLSGLRETCDAHGSLLLLDEVQVGVGRTGTMLGAEHWGVRADAIALAKGLGGGFPIGVMLLREHLAAALPPGMHGSTFGGNPLASAAARTVLRVIRESGLMEAVTRQGERLGEGLADIAKRYPHHCTGERGLGLLRALTLTEAATARQLLPSFLDHGLLLTAAGTKALRFTPPLIVTEAEVDEALERVDATLESLQP